MNRILIRQSELDETGRVVLCGRRANHILHTLKAVPGQPLRMGVISGPKGEGIVHKLTDDTVVMDCILDSGVPPPPAIDLLLALPRPKVMKRLWSPLAMMGLDQLVLTNAAKVERNYFDTHWLRPESYEPLMVLGLEQSGDTCLPRVSIRRRLKPFMEDELDTIFPKSRRLCAHPVEGGLHGPPALKYGERVLLAVGPEGGWTDFELNLLQDHGFKLTSIGGRTLRTDVACISVLAVINHLLESR
jgi:RsmE family RNA methyltransferase